MPDYSGSFSGSYQGNGNQLTNIDYYSLSNIPTTVTPFQKNSILANNSVRDNFVSNVKARLSAESVISSSAQLTTEFDVRYGNEVGDNLVSGSSQINYNSIQNKPTTITGGQAGSIVTNSAKTGITTVQRDAILANSAKVGYTDTAVKNKLSTEGVISGSSQITSIVSNTYISSSAAASGFGAGSGLQLGTTNSTALVGNTTTITTVQRDAIIANSAKVGYTDTAVKNKLNTESVISSSAQIAGLGYLTSQTDAQELTLSGTTLTISTGNSVSLAGLGGAGGAGGTSIWNTGSQAPESYTHLMTSNNLKVTGSVDIKGNFTVNGQTVFTQTSASDAGNALVVNGRIKVLEETIGSYIASASIQVGNSKDTIDGGGFF